MVINNPMLLIWLYFFKIPCLNGWRGCTLPHVCMCGPAPRRLLPGQSLLAWSLPGHWWGGSGASDLDEEPCESGKMPGLAAAGKDNSTKTKKYIGKSTQKSRHNLFWLTEDQDRVVCKIQQNFTFTRGSGIPVTEDESINFFRSWWRNSKTR